MAIIHMGWHENDTFRDGAYTPLEMKSGVLSNPGYYLYSTHHGLCLFDREVNGYHDSDFYMIVWNPEKGEPERIEFASTRGWSYPCYASRPDATDEVRAEYKAWQDKQAADARRRSRKAQACKYWGIRATMLAAGAAHGFPHWRMFRLWKTVGTEDFERLMKLFSPRLRSQFKIKLRTQVIEWLKQDAPKYKTPLSRKQMEYV